MHVPINVKSPNNISEWQMGFNSAFKGLKIFQNCFKGQAQAKYFSNQMNMKEKVHSLQDENNVAELSLEGKVVDCF